MLDNFCAELRRVALLMTYGESIDAIRDRYPDKNPIDFLLLYKAAEVYNRRSIEISDAAL